MPPLVSIVVATRNASLTLPRLLASLRAQTFRGFETVVIDGASTDGTPELLREAGDVVTAWRSEPDSGTYDAWNKALGLARGDWFCFLGADDWLWDEQSLERLAPHLRAAPREVRVVYGRVRWVDAAGATLEELGRPWPEAAGPFRRGHCLPHPGLMHHRSLFETRGAFDPTYGVAADYELLLRELGAGEALFVPTLVAGVSFGGVSTRPENFLAILRDTERALRAHGLAPPPFAWACRKAAAALYLGLRAVAGDGAARRAADLFRRATLRRPRFAAARGAGSEKPN